MSKRRHTALEDTEFEEETETFQVTLNATIVPSLVRLFLARQAKALKTRREHLVPLISKNGPRGNLKQWIQALNEEFEKLLGLRVEVGGTEYYVVSCFDDKAKGILHELLQDDTQKPEQTQMDVNQLMAANKRLPIVGNTVENCLSGVLLLVIVFVVLSQNRISENTLFEALQNFGLSNRLNITNPIFNSPLQNIVADLVRREYVEKIKSTIATQAVEANVDYTLGKRAIREFPPSTIKTLLEHIISLPDQQSKIETALRRCFPDYVPTNEADIVTEKSVEEGSQPTI